MDGYWIKAVKRVWWLVSFKPQCHAARCSLVFFAGCYSVLFMPQLASVTTLIICLLGLALVACRYPLLRLLAVFLAGLTWMTWHAGSALNQQLAVDFEKQTLRVLVEVADFPQGDNAYRKLKVVLRHVELQGAKRPNQPVLAPNSRLRLACYFCNVEFALGEQWQLDVVLRRPRGLQSWQAFDFEKYALSERLAATGYIKRVHRQIESDEVSLSTLFSQWRLHIRRQLHQTIQDPSALALVAALSIGDRSFFTEDIWQTLRTMGLTHIVAISGLHIGLVFLMSKFLARRALNFVSPLYLIMPACYLETLLALASAAVYAALTGFSIPAQRALIMLAMYCFTLFCAVKPSPLTLLSLCVGIIMLIDPLAILGYSFWLSVGAVLLIISVQMTRKRSLVYLQWALSLMMAPLLLKWFGEVSLVSPLVNLVVVPILSWVILPGLLVAAITLLMVPMIGQWIIMHIAQWLGWLWNGIGWLEQVLPMTSTTLSMTSNQYSILVGGIVVMIFSRMLPNKRLLVLLLGIAWYLSYDKPMLAPDEFIVTVLDVGQGLSVSIETSQGVSLFDTGYRYGEQDSARHIIIPYLRHRHVKRLQSLVVSHEDLDHIGGLSSLLSAYSVQRLFTSFSLENTPHAKQQFCLQGMRWQESGVTFQFISPSAELLQTQVSRNDRSCVLLIHSALGRVLVPGDISRQIEHQLIMSANESLSADVLVLAHHGSHTSSSPAFLHHVDPDIVIASSGYRSKHGHPHPEVVARVRRLGMTLLNTADSGSIQIAFRKTGLQTIEYRAKQRRFWYASD